MGLNWFKYPAHTPPDNTLLLIQRKDGDYRLVIYFEDTREFVTVPGRFVQTNVKQWAVIDNEI